MQTPPDSLKFKTLTSDDIPQALELSQEAHWNQIADDWQFMISNGDAFGFSSHENQLISSALALPFEGSFGWISMVLVSASWRRKGLATKLLQQAIEILEIKGKIPLLDATDAGRKVYLSMGFNDLYPISRLEKAQGQQSQVSPLALPASVTLRQIRESDLARLAAWDQQFFGANRSTLLSNLFHRNPHLAFLAEDSDEAILGFSMGRKGQNATQVGPVVSESSQIAASLIQELLAQSNEAILIDVPDHQEKTHRWLLNSGFSCQRKFMRMGKGISEPLDKADTIFAIAGPELG